jgi:hypothetical protein
MARKSDSADGWGSSEPGIFLLHPFSTNNYYNGDVILDIPFVIPNFHIRLFTYEQKTSNYYPIRRSLDGLFANENKRR